MAAHRARFSSSISAQRIASRYRTRMGFRWITGGKTELYRPDFGEYLESPPQPWKIGPGPELPGLSVLQDFATCVTEDPQSRRI